MTGRKMKAAKEQKEEEKEQEAQEKEGTAPTTLSNKLLSQIPMHKPLSPLVHHTPR